MNHNVKLNITEPLEDLRARDLKKNGKQRGCVIKGKTEKFLKYKILKFGFLTKVHEIINLTFQMGTREISSSFMYSIN